jgi:hypothetical protein
MSAIGNFFKKVGHDLKVAALDVEHGAVKALTVLFGAQQAQALIQGAESMLETDFGAVLIDAGKGLAATLAGKPSVTLFEALVTTILKEAESAGVQVAEGLARLLASLIELKLTGGASTVPAAPSS